MNSTLGDAYNEYKATKEIAFWKWEFVLTELYILLSDFCAKKYARSNQNIVIHGNECVN